MKKYAALLSFLVLSMALPLRAKTVSIPIQQGDTVSFEDGLSEGGTGYFEYFNRGTLAGTRYVAVEQKTSEGTYFLLINKKTGSVFRLDDRPALSKDKSRIATAVGGLLSGRAENRLCIYRLVEDSIGLEFEMKGSDLWGPREPLFSGDNTVRFTKVFFTSFGDDLKKGQVTESVRRAGEAWVYEEKYEIQEDGKTGLYRAVPKPKPVPAPPADSAAAAPIP